MTDTPDHAAGVSGSACASGRDAVTARSSLLGRRGFLALQSTAVLAGALALTPGQVLASGRVTIDVELATDTARVGAKVGMVVVVTEENGPGGLPEPSILGGDTLLIQRRGGVSTSQSARWVNGEASSKRTWTYQYTVTPLKPGTHEIPIEVALEDGTATPEFPAAITASGQAIEIRPPPEDSIPTKQAAAKQNVIMWGWTEVKTAYVGEEVLYGLDIWHRNEASLEISQLPTFDDFLTSELELDDAQSSEVDRRSFEVQPVVRRLLVPQRAGTLVVSGGEIIATPVAQGFGMFRPARVGTPQRIKGRSAALEVLPLPAEGQPAGFRGTNVGSYTITTSVDREILKVGEAVTLKVVVEGRGNLGAIDPGEWPTLSGLERYEPAVTSEVDATAAGTSGKKTWTFLVVAGAAGSLEIPAHTLHFFNPKSATYETVSSQPITLEVIGDGSEVPASTTQDEQVSGDEEAVLAQPFFDEALVRSPVPAAPLDRRVWWASVLAGPALAGTVLALRKLAQRAQGDAATQERRARERWVRERWNTAHAHVRAGDELFTALSELLSARAIGRLGAQAQGRPRAQLESMLRRDGLAPELLAQWTATLGACDAARFGGAALSEEQRAAMLKASREIIDDGRWQETAASSTDPSSRGRRT